MYSVLDFWFNPIAYIGNFHETKKNSLLIPLMITGIAIPFTMLLTENLLGNLGTANFLFSIKYRYLSTVLYFLISNFLLSAIFFFLSGMMNADNSPHNVSAIQFFFLFILAQTPLLIMPSLALIIKLTGLKIFATGLIRFIMLLWIFLLQLNIIKSVFSFTSAKSIIIYFTALLLIFLSTLLSVFNLVFKLIR